VVELARASSLDICLMTYSQTGAVPGNQDNSGKFLLMDILIKRLTAGEWRKALLCYPFSEVTRESRPGFH
jgi:hypothetical protein